jgi:transcriptional regulator with XRE-family HTH domain
MPDMTLLVRARIRAEIRAHGRTQRWVADQLGLSQPQVWHRLHGNVEWRTSEVERLADALGVPASMFYRPATDAERAS